MKYDSIIVGAGPAGIFCAYEFTKLDPTKKILLIEKGKDIYNRKCPILNKIITKCPIQPNGIEGCLPACNMTSGFGGCGAYSDGKFNITTEFGGWLNEYLDDNELMDLINYVDNINVQYGAPQETTNPYTKKVREIEKKGLTVGLKLLRSKVRHLGTEINLKVLANIYEYLKDKIEFKFCEEVLDVVIENKQIKGVITNKDKYEGDNVIIVPGRDGAVWIEKLAKKYKFKTKNNRVDIGVRVETNNEIMEEINENLYEGKFIYRTNVGTTVRTFCSNPSGYVVVENHSGTILANGHAYNDAEKGSKNTNFALLVSHEFTEPFNEPNKFAHYVSTLANMLSNGSVIVQRYGDLKKGRRSTEERIKEGFVQPTLKEAVPGDLGLVLPYKTMKSLIEMIEALNFVTPGINSEHTLFYGVEAKFYSSRPVVNNNFESQEIKGLYFGGDGAGFTRGLAQAESNGVWIARKIIENNK